MSPRSTSTTSSDANKAKPSSGKEREVQGDLAVCKLSVMLKKGASDNLKARPGRRSQYIWAWVEEKAIRIMQSARAGWEVPQDGLGATPDDLRKV